MQTKDQRSKKQTGTNIKLPLIVFEEDGTVVCYCPALDLAGTGYSEKEAIDSYKYVIAEYFDHTIHAKTLEKDLLRLGWQIKKNLHKSIVPPAVTHLLENNSNFKRVFEKFDYKKFSANILFPAIS